MINNEDFAIWWTTQHDCEAIGEGHTYKGDEDYWATQEPKYLELFFFVDLSPWPAYIGQEYISRCGRAGRGRLWCPDDIPLTEIKWDESKPTAERASRSGGIVIHRRDVEMMKKYPGMITDLDMNKI